MSAPRKADGRAPRHRKNLRGKVRPCRFNLQVAVYDKLVTLAREDETGAVESNVEVVERLILSARPAQPQPTK